tara:strand:- start:295 stop:567 length:273 start_codon:yes stop_codon:yes gene_type:complete
MPKNKSDKKVRNKQKRTYTKRGGCKCNKSFFGGKDKNKTIKNKRNRNRKMKGGNNPIDVLLGRDEFFNNPITSGISFKGSVIAKDVINAN